MAPEQRSNAAGPDTDTSVQGGAGTGRLMMQTLVNDRARERERESGVGLLKVIASSLCWGGTVHFFQVTVSA